MQVTQQQVPSTDEGFVDDGNGVWVRALYDYNGTDTSALSFSKGALIEVFTQLETGWWDGVLDDERGWFPSNYVQLLTPAEAEAQMATVYESAQENEPPPTWDQHGQVWNGRSNNISRSGSTRRRSAAADDFWMPEVSADGQIYYLNSKTGETSRELPTSSSSVVDPTPGLADALLQPGQVSAYETLRQRSLSSAQKASGNPSSWVQRLADDGISHYWFNTATGEAQWHEPPASVSVNGISDGYEDPEAGYQALRKGFTDDYAHAESAEEILRRLSVYSDASDTQSTTGTPNTAQYLSPTHHSSHSHSVTNTYYSQQDIAERNAKDLQLQLAPKAAEALTELSALVKQAITEIIDAGSSASVATAIPNDSAPEVAAMDRVSAVVVSVRNLLYSSGTLAAPLSSLLPQTAEAAESSRSPMLELRPFQRKVTATLSKLVLSARAAKSNAAASTGLPVLDARVDFDAAELDRAIMTLVAEIQRTSAYGRSKRLRAAFDSADGPGGVGLGNPGGGIGGHLKALGFVPAEDASERQVLGRNLSEELLLCRTKVEEQLDPLESHSKRIQDVGPVAVTELSSLLAFVEDIDVASYLDVNGSRGTGTEEYTASATEARALLRGLEWTKQAIFDEGMLLLMMCEGERETMTETQSHQDVFASHSRAPTPAPIPAQVYRAAQLARSIRAHIHNVQDVIEELVQIAEQQALLRRSSTAVAARPRQNPRPIRPLRDSMVRLSSSGLGIVDRPDSPLQVADETAALVAMDIPRTSSPNGEFVDMEDAFRTTRIAPTTTQFNGKAPPVSGANGVVGQRSTFLDRTSMITLQSVGPPSYHTRADTPAGADDTDDDEDLRPVARSPPRRGQSNSKLRKVLGDDIPAADERPWYLEPAYTDTELLFTPDGTGVRGGTVPALVERLTFHFATDTVFNEAFMITFKSFTTPPDLVDLLIARFEKEPPEGLTAEELLDWKRNWQDPVRGRVITIMRRLLVEDDCISKDDTIALEKLRGFVTKHDSDHPQIKTVASSLHSLSTTGIVPTRKISKSTPIGAPTPIVPKLNQSKKLKLLDIDPLEVARQLTLMESELFARIRGMECLARAKEGQTDNDNIRVIIQMSNNVRRFIRTVNQQQPLNMGDLIQIANWVNDVVLSKEDARKRALLIKHFVLITDKCRQLNNFSTMAALVAALNSPPIRRLKRSWDQINSRHITMLEELENLMQAGKSLPEYRALLSKFSLPCIPFIGVYLTTLTFIQDGMKDILAKEGNLINFVKRAKAAAIITEIKRYQSAPYHLVAVEPIQHFINDSLRVERPQDFYWELSLQREPRERDDEKMARLLQESGFL